MTPTEFKAWFDGFTEALSGTPNEEQWTRIKSRVAEIDGRPVTERVYVNHYWPRHFLGYYTGGYPHITCGASAVGQSSMQASSQVTAFNSIDAMYLAGKNDAALIA